MSKSYTLTTDVKGKILKTAAESIYENTAIKIREAVTNAVDNEATTFILTLRKNEETGLYVLSLFDNGNGITVEDFKEIFKNIGRGRYLDEQDPKTKYSHYGLGLMSVFELGKNVSVITKTKSSGQVLKLEVDSHKLFSREMEKQSISKLNACFKLIDSTKEERDKISPLTTDTVKSMLGRFPRGFTEFIIEDVNVEDVGFINYANFIIQLRKSLPLRADVESPLFKSLKSEHKKRFFDILNDAKVCPTISFHYSLSADDKHSEIFKYLPTFRHVSSNNYAFYTENNDSFSYYLIVGRRALGTPEENVDAGLWFRSRNVLVKGPDFLSYQGRGDRVCDTVVGDWIFGEFFHVNMIDFLDASRNNFKFGHEDFQLFKSAVRDIVSPKCQELRVAYKKGHDIETALKTTYDDFKQEEKSPLKELERKIARIERLGEEDGDHEVKTNRILERLSSIHNSGLENCKDFYESIKTPIDFTPEGMEEKYNVRIDPKAMDSSITENQVVIPAKIFESFDMIFFGKEFKVRFVKSEIKQAISFNLTKIPREITLNLTYPELLKYNIAYIEVIGALEYASKEAAEQHECSYKCPNGKVFDCTECLDVMKRIVAETLAGKEHKDQSKIFKPLFGA